MDGNTMIGFYDAYVRCKYCGEKFHYNECDPEQGLKADEDKRKHEGHCLVRLGLKPCPKEWKEKLDKAHEMIKSCEKEIEELRETLEKGTILPSLRKAAKDAIGVKKTEIRGYKASIGEEFDDFFDELNEVLKLKKER